MTPLLTYSLDHRFPVAVVRLHGELTPLTAPKVRAAVLESLVEEPTSVVVDLSGLTAVEQAVLPVFAGAAAEATAWPGTSLLLCCPPEDLTGTLRQVAERDELPLHPTVNDALVVAAAQPVPQRMHQRFEPTVNAPRTAREMAAATCADWEVQSIAIPAEILASELVTNAVRHARTALDLRLTLRDQHVRVSVQDRTVELARLQTPAESDDHGRGLLIVDAVATAWGNVRVPDGKVVWASLPNPTVH